MNENGYSLTQAMIEATRCLMCADAPCTCDCPAGVDARSFIRKIRFDNLEGAVRSLKSRNVLAASCGYICPTGTLCAKGCSSTELTTPIDISGLQRFVMDWERDRGMIDPLISSPTGKMVAIVGSGPAGLGCAAELAIRGHDVTIFEKRNALGGMLRRCIPSFRLPDEVIDFEIDFMRKLGVKFEMGRRVESAKKLLDEGYGAVFLAAGLDHARGGDIPGADLEGSYQAISYLEASKTGNPPDLGSRTVVIGGGDTALDAARMSRRAGSECFILYRRTQREMPAYPNEVDDAWNEGVEFYFRVIVREVLGDGKVEGVRCSRVRWRNDESGKARRYDIEGDEFVIACDSVLFAVGQDASSDFGLDVLKNGLIEVGTDTMATSEKGVFAGGDIVFGGGTAARAVGHGKDVAVEIDDYLK
jgi:NADPH-dependent glutamate synthase beta subunit-like oxidoreductase